MSEDELRAEQNKMNRKGTYRALTWTESDAHSERELGYDVCSVARNKNNWINENNPKFMVAGIAESRGRCFFGVRIMETVSA